MTRRPSSCSCCVSTTRRRGSHTAGKWPQIEEVTAADFVYVRLHGAESLRQRYTTRRWTSGRKAAGLHQGLDRLHVFSTTTEGLRAVRRDRMISRVSG